MLLDGIYVMVQGKYIGPEKPGPWAGLFSSLDINVFHLGPLFIVYGLCWLSWIYGLWSKQRWAYTAGLFLSIFTLWYFPAGTLLSIFVIIILLTGKKKINN